jgi:hypothetical protein
VRRTCHECKTMFFTGNKTCDKCGHIRCTDCPRDPYVTFPDLVNDQRLTRTADPRRTSIPSDTLVMSLAPQASHITSAKNARHSIQPMQPMVPSANLAVIPRATPRPGRNHAKLNRSLIQRFLSKYRPSCLHFKSHNGTHLVTNAMQLLIMVLERIRGISRSRRCLLS